MRAQKIVVFSLAIYASLAWPVPQLQAIVIPPMGLAPGSQYQLIFVTYNGIAGSYTSEAPYNAFANSEAALNPSLPSTSWRAVTSTADGTNANINAPSDGLPVYNTAGQLVAPAATGLYTENLVNPILYNQFGNSSQGPPVDPGQHYGNAWTGSGPNGMPVNSANWSFLPARMGDAHPVYGASYDPSQGWAAVGQSGNLPLGSVYALSAPILLPIPEPSGIVLAALGFGGIIAAARRARVTPDVRNRAKGRNLGMPQATSNGKGSEVGTQAF